jgi:hypothetical protein
MCNATELRAVDLSSSHQFEEVIGAASSENGLFIAKMEFSIQTPPVLAALSAIRNTIARLATK